MAQWQRPSVREETHLWKMYQEGISYQIKEGLRHNIPKYIDFYEGRQWPRPTENTKNLPRPVVNIVKMICRSKKSSILSTPVRIVYKSYRHGIDMEKLNSFAESLQREMGQDELDRLAIDDGIKKGSYFYHYYWDNDAVNLKGEREGGVRCEIIDPLNIFFSNPCQLDEQKQQWILISTHTDPGVVEEMCESPLDKEKIKEEARENGGKITLLTRYFKKNGEIWCEKGTKHQILWDPFPLSPYSIYNEAYNLLHDDNMSSSKAVNKEKQDNKMSFKDSYPSSTAQIDRIATLFPIVCGNYERKEGSIYGISEIEGIIPNQKSINFNIAMSLLDAQQCAWGKYIALPNALKGQKISNSPGQVLIDHSGTGNGIKKMSEGALSSVPMEITQLLADLTKTVTGANDLLSSDALRANMSGVAIAQLQAQAEVPIEDVRSGFWSAKRKQGMVLAQFIRLFYYEREFIRRKRDENGNECEICDSFSSKEYENCVFDVTVEAIRGTKASTASDINLLDNCLNTGKISLETYIKAYPEGAISNKTEILRQIEAEKESEIYKLRKELERYKNSKTLDPVSEF